MDDGKIKIICGDGREGFVENAPYDVIHVGAAADKIPQALKDQLAVGGIMMIPVGPEHGNQYIQLCTKDDDGEVQCKKLLGVR